jgi:hypothetical protein
MRVDVEVDTDRPPPIPDEDDVLKDEENEG